MNDWTATIDPMPALQQGYEVLTTKTYVPYEITFWVFLGALIGRLVFSRR